jgi:hypothetical protein
MIDYFFANKDFLAHTKWSRLAENWTGKRIFKEHSKTGHKYVQF